MTSVQRLLKGVTVFELAGLAPGPLCGQMLADYGAKVVRIDRPTQSTTNFDQLVRGKRSIAVDLRNPKGQKAIRTILESDKVDVLIDTYRPGVLEKLNILPEKRPENKPPLIVARLTGYGQEGPLAKFAGHDLNYLAASGVLDVMGPPGKPPSIPANILGDFAGLSLPGFSAIVTALYSNMREFISGNKSLAPYTLIDVNIVESLKYLSQFPIYIKHGGWDSTKTKEENEASKPKGAIVTWDNPRGENVLEGHVCPFYTIYETADKGKYVTVACLEPQFYDEFVKLITNNDKEAISKLPNRLNPANWAKLKAYFQDLFSKHGFDHWEKEALKYPDSCVMPVKNLPHSSEVPRQIVEFKESSEGAQDDGIDRTKSGYVLRTGKDTNEVLSEFLGSNWKSEFGSDFATQARDEKL